MVDHDLARHEAGHATVAAALGIPVLYIQISREPVGAVIDHPTDANEVKREDLDARFAGEALTPLEYSEAGLALIADEVTVYLGGLAGESVSQTPAAFSATRAADDLAKVFRLIAKYTEHLPEDDRDARVRDYFQERQGAAWNLIVTHCKTHFILADVMVNGHDLSKNEITDMIRNMGEMPVPK
ncbi:hypothetical protein PMI01_00241 [Caulobacter sp. AP07]|nr:hypothetical protein PMI01_00241 [Caulobacter sp. AP07]